MVLSTTNSIEGFKIADYKGIVTGVAINEQKLSMGFNASKYYKTIQESIDTTKERAFQILRENAKNVGANAVVGIKIDIELLASNYAMVSITGTAVTVV